jgi:type II secretory pathway pseudopilin PulG
MGAMGFAQSPGPVPYAPGGAKPTNGLAIASLVLSIIWLAGLGSVLAVIFGIVARRQIRASGGRQGGEGLALAGALIGVVGILGLVLVVTLVVTVNSAVENALHSQAASCRADATSVEIALRAYRAQNESYPTLLAPWSAATYTTNYAVLTTAGRNGGPWLKSAPPTSNYVIEYDSDGRVWVEGIGTYDAVYNPVQDFDLQRNACNIASQ